MFTATKKISFLAKVNLLVVLLVVSASLNAAESQQWRRTCWDNCLSNHSLCVSSSGLSATSFKSCRTEGQKCMDDCKQKALLRALRDELESDYVMS